MPELAYIQFLNGPRINEKVKIENTPLTFGRTSDSAIQINWDGLVSSRHFEVYLDEGTLFLRDSGSRNGTKINGVAVVRQRLYSGDIIEVGSTQFQITIVQEPGKTTPPANNVETPSQGAVHSRSLTTGPKKINPFESSYIDDIIPAQQTNPIAEPPIIQQVRLRIADQPSSGIGTQPARKLFWLSPGQSMVFGRSPRCDCSIESDSFLSSTHFKVTCGQQQCLVEDLGSKAGTLLNNVAITQASIFHGDRLLAGRTEFQIEIDGDRGPIVRTDKSNVSKPGIVPVELSVPLKEPLDLTREKCPSGAYVLKGMMHDQLPLDMLISWIRSAGKIYLIFDPSRSTRALPSDYDPVSGQLFFWLPPELASSSPQLALVEELPEWQVFVKQLIGNDGLIVLQSETGKEELLMAVRACLTGDPNLKKPFQGITGICWPSVMAAAISSSAGNIASQLFKSVNLVLAEESSGVSYRIFASEPEKIESVLRLLDQRQIKYSINRSEAHA